mmetsp:Transcript_61569/g.141942  ORF Transcript_61569/g.141942 Transcript_61569/m.141942 type:complete len:253 (-) Transcript_61569:497-1255(-)
MALSHHCADLLAGSGIKVGVALPSHPPSQVNRLLQSKRGGVIVAWPRPSQPRPAPAAYGHQACTPGALISQRRASLAGDAERAEHTELSRDPSRDLGVTRDATSGPRRDRGGAAPRFGVVPRASCFGSAPTDADRHWPWARLIAHTRSGMWPLGTFSPSTRLKTTDTSRASHWGGVKAATHWNDCTISSGEGLSPSFVSTSRRSFISSVLCLMWKLTPPDLATFTERSPACVSVPIGECSPSSCSFSCFSRY